MSACCSRPVERDPSTTTASATARGEQAEHARARAGRYRRRSVQAAAGARTPLMGAGHRPARGLDDGVSDRCDEPDRPERDHHGGEDDGPRVGLPIGDGLAHTHWRPLATSHSSKAPTAGQAAGSARMNSYHCGACLASPAAVPAGWGRGGPSARRAPRGKASTPMMAMATITCTNRAALLFHETPRRWLIGLRRPLPVRAGGPPPLW